MNQEGPKCQICGSETTIYARIIRIRDDCRLILLYGIKCEADKNHDQGFTVSIEDILNLIDPKK
jgi:hypothetical protein